MYNKLVDYICNVVPGMLNVKYPAINGHIAKMIFNAEIDGNVLFKHEQFRGARDRAELMIPYQVPKDFLKTRERILNVLECAILNHRQIKHGEKNGIRIKNILEEMPYSEIELSIMKADFWN